MAPQSPSMKPRRALIEALTRMHDAPVLLLEGPRSVGKSTLLREIASACGGRLVDLDEPTTRAAVVADASLLVGGDEPVLIDEYQKAPQILDAVKAELNAHTSPGRFVLAGSARHDALPAAAQALTGRLSRLPVYPLSQGELAEVHEDFLACALRSPTALVTARVSTTLRDEYIARMCTGGFPLAIAATDRGRQRWFDDYVTLTLDRDVRELSKLRRGPQLADLLRRLAGQTAQVLNIKTAAEDIGLATTTAESYATLLEKVFLISRLEGWGRTLSARSAVLPKVHVVDSGVAARLLRLTPAKIAARDPAALTELGHLLESFVVGEILKQASWSDEVVGVGHWRTYEGVEVDLVVERGDGGVVGFEIKAGDSVPDKELKGLRMLRDKLGDSFVAGFALYLGRRSYTPEDRLHVVPLDHVWTPHP
ncbi:MAG: ATP-binding protein [Acidobacteriota bacterium]|nr:ATP-binding protein [Acidobacteriota bacterium]